MAEAVRPAKSKKRHQKQQQPQQQKEPQKQHQSLSVDQADDVTDMLLEADDIVQPPLDLAKLVSSQPSDLPEAEAAVTASDDSVVVADSEPSATEESQEEQAQGDAEQSEHPPEDTAQQEQQESHQNQEILAQADPEPEAVQRPPIVAEAEVSPPPAAPATVAEPAAVASPLTEAQLRSLYHNPLLNHLDYEVQQYLNEADTQDSEFHEMLSSYCVACKKLRRSEANIRQLESDLRELQDSVWQLSTQTQSVEGKCQDGVKVSTEFRYDVAEFKAEGMKRLSDKLAAARRELENDVPLHGYDTQKWRLLIQCHLHKLVSGLPMLAETPPSAPPVVLPDYPRSDGRAQADEVLRRCRVLFHFARKPILTTDQAFQDDVRAWLIELGGTLLRCATWREHLYLLCELLRCPPGVGDWGACLVQLPADQLIDSASGNGGSSAVAAADLCLAALQLIVCPVAERARFMAPFEALDSLPAGEQPQHQQQQQQDDSSRWIFVDEEGEAYDNQRDALTELRDTDLLALLSQLPLHSLLRSLFASAGDNSPQVPLPKLLAFVNSFVSIAELGFDSLKQAARYRLVSRWLGHVIRQALVLLSDRFLAESTVNYQPQQWATMSATMERVFLRCVRALLSAGRHGSWQYLTELPLDCLSGQCKLSLINTLLQDCGLIELESRLTALSPSEAIYLLTSLSNVACQCDASVPDQRNLLLSITDEIFNLAFVREHTRDLCGKVGCELLTSIGLRHPLVLREMLDYVDRAKLDMVFGDVLSLFKDLPFQTFVPDKALLTRFLHWLTLYPLKSLRSCIARLVLDGFNWSVDFNNPAVLFLPHETHVEVALILVQASQQLFSNKSFAQQLRSGGINAFPPQSVEERFYLWCVNLMARLRLHLTSLPTLNAHAAAAELRPDRVDPQSALFRGLLKEGLEADNPVAVYAALVMTRLGNNTGELLSTGLTHLTSLCRLKQTRLALEFLGQAAAMLTPTEPATLYSNPTAHSALATLAMCDDAWWNQHRVPGGQRTFPGPNLRLIGSALLGSPAGIEPWLRSLLLQAPACLQNRGVLYLIDRLCCQAVVLDAIAAQQPQQQQQQQGFDTMLSCIRSACQAFNNGTGSGGGSGGGGGGGFLKSVAGLFSGGRSFLLDGVKAEADRQLVPWLRFGLLLVETREEDDSGIWTALISRLAETQHHQSSASSVSPQTAFQKARSRIAASSSSSGSSSNKLEFNQLAIFRWADFLQDLLREQQASASAPEKQEQPSAATCAVLALACEQFFLRYFARAHQHAGSQGERLFVAANLTSQIKFIRGRLRDIGRQLVAAGQQPLLANHLEAFALWIDEPRLHSESLILAALPPQYLSQRLCTLLLGQAEPWLELLPIDELRTQLESLAHSWLRRADVGDAGMRRLQDRVRRPPRGGGGGSNDEPADRIAARLDELANRFKPVAPPSALAAAGSQQQQQLWQDASLMTLPNASILGDKVRLLHYLEERLACLTLGARDFNDRSTKLLNLDLNYTENLPHLYCLVAKEQTFNVACGPALQLSVTSPIKRCSGPARLFLRYQEAAPQPGLSQLLEENRTQARQLCIEALLPPSQKLVAASVYLDWVVASLGEAQAETGVALFYHLTGLVSELTKFYPPTRQLLTGLIECLGQTFIRRWPGQAQPLLEAVLQTPSLVELLAPNFDPLSSGDLFVQMYTRIVPVLKDYGIEVLFALLSKFDVSEWLKTRPGAQERNNLIGAICSGLCTCGPSPAPSLCLIFDLYQVHLSAVLQFEFPLHFHPGLQRIFAASCTGKIPPVAWRLLCNCVAADTADDRELSMSIDQIADVLRWLAALLQRERTARLELYSQWNVYLEHVMSLVASLVRCLGYKVCRSVSRRHLNPAAGADTLWEAVRPVFAPFLEPLESTHSQSQSVGAPFNPGHSEMAGRVLDCLVEIVCQLDREFQHTLGSNCVEQPSGTSAARAPIHEQLLLYYCQRLAAPQFRLPAYVLAALHSSLAKADWRQLLPGLPAMQVIADFYRTAVSASQQFLAGIVSEIDWSSEALTDHRQMLFHLVLCMTTSQEIIRMPEFARLLDTSARLNWHCVRSDTYESMTTWLATKWDPMCMLRERTSAAYLAVAFLQKSAEFSAPLQPDDRSGLIKQCLCTRMCIQLLCQCLSAGQTALSKEELASKFATAVSNLLTEVESCLVYAALPDDQKFAHGCALCQEVLNLLRNNSPAVQRVCLSSLQDWCENSGSGPLVLPLIRCLTAAPANTASTVRLLETLMTAFVVAIASNESTPQSVLSHLLAVFQLPSSTLEPFLSECVTAESLLTLLLCLHIQLGLSSVANQRRALLARCCDWLRSVKVSVDGEVRYLALLDRCFDALVMHLTPEDDQWLNRQLHQLLPCLLTLSEDKSSAGFLGAIGLGRRSAMSAEFRFTARAAASLVQVKLDGWQGARTQQVVAGLRAARANRAYTGAISEATIDQVLAFVDTFGSPGAARPRLADICRVLRFTTHRAYPSSGLPACKCLLPTESELLPLGGAN
ncbi:hypothetical protein BOX15_Mlig010112g1 [Macrostomum lignano]|uniref:Ectopic P granules protein 5 homolog n=1 Tax=Macrostomum lignano TaxID=282301 RepID=A0A267FAM9_9PLAT|nr:hypothetical protein BOX15_Mlig010112g1 [Macrostomum lignano]